MDVKHFLVTLKCLFCGESLEGPEDADCQSGDLIKCERCGEESDYDSVFEVAKEDAVGIVRDSLYGALGGMLKRKS